MGANRSFNLNESNMDSLGPKGSNYDSKPKKNQDDLGGINLQMNQFLYDLIHGVDENGETDPIIEFEEDKQALGLPEGYDPDYVRYYGFLYQIYAEKINLISDNFNETFLNKLKDTYCVGELTEFLIRDKNELWKFMYFLFSCLKHVDVQKECFQSKPKLFLTPC